MPAWGASRIGRAITRRLPSRALKRAGIQIPDRPEDSGPLLARLLHENCLAFWYPSCVDLAMGGYAMARDEWGRPTGDAHERVIVTQSRMLWFFSRLVAGGLGGPEHLAAAAHGFRFLRDCMWDDAEGGFFWSVDARTGRPLKDGKHVYAQSCALYALSRYASVSGDRGAANLARTVARLVESRARDAAYGGYTELFTRDWKPWPAAERDYLSDVPPGTKRYNTHLHWFEALVEYVDLVGDDDMYPPLRDLAGILTEKVVRTGFAACTDEHFADWAPMPGGEVSYGHDIESVWLLRDADRRTGVVGAARLGTHLELYNSALRYGWDERDGGLFAYGPPGCPPTRRNKLWWAQGETLVAALYLWRETASDEYAAHYVRTLDWIVNAQVDWIYGEWHRDIAANGRHVGAKADGWKAAYHNGRALMTCLDLLDVRGSAPGA